jgi:hypothetical protein
LLRICLAVLKERILSQIRGILIRELGFQLRYRTVLSAKRAANSSRKEEYEPAGETYQDGLRSFHGPFPPRAQRMLGTDTNISTSQSELTQRSGAADLQTEARKSRVLEEFREVLAQADYRWPYCRLIPTENSICGKRDTKSARKVLKSSPWARHLIELKRVRRTAFHL